MDDASAPSVVTANDSPANLTHPRLDFIPQRRLLDRSLAEPMACPRISPKEQIQTHFRAIAEFNSHVEGAERDRRLVRS